MADRSHLGKKKPIHEEVRITILSYKSKSYLDADNISMLITHTTKNSLTCIIQNVFMKDI